jgi:hypothetical protein
MGTGILPGRDVKTPRWLRYHVWSSPGRGDAPVHLLIHGGVVVKFRNQICTSIVALALIATVPTVARAQNQPVSGGDDSTVLVGAGLTFLNVSESTGVGAAANVLFNTLKVTGNGRIGVVGDLGFNHYDFGTFVTAMGGGRYTFTTTGKVVPYGQFLVGITHCCGDTDFHPALGFGVDVAWRPQVNFRGEIQFIFADANATRFFLGVSLPIAKKR